MTLEKVIEYTNADLSPESDLEKLEGNSKVALRPRNADDGGNAHVVLYSNFKEQEGNDLPSLVTWGLKDLAYDSWFSCEAVKYIKEASGGPVNHLGHDNSFALATYSARYNNLQDFTVEFRYTPKSVAAGVKVIAHEYFYYSLSNRGRWVLDRNGSELKFITIDENGNAHALDTSGLGLLADTEYIIRVSYHAVGNGTSQARISVDGSEVASTDSAKLLKTFDEEDCPLITLGAYPDASDSPPDRRLSDSCYIGDLAVYNSVLSTSYTPRAGLLKIFSQDEPKVTVALDSGLLGQKWDASSIVFTDESDFTDNGIKIRWDSDNDNSPEFSGDPLTLSEFRGGKVNVLSGKPSVTTRRKPEIVRR
jgi:hypothetical protein